MAKPSVSIILPTFNRAGIIIRAIESVITQTFREWELLIIDDGSIDNTILKINPYLKKYPNIRYFYQPHRGSTLSRQAGIKKAEADLVTFIDSDDYYKPCHLQQNLNFINKEPSVDAVLSKSEIIGNPYVTDIRDTSKMIHIDECCLFGTFFIRKKVFTTIKKLPESKIGAEYLLYQLMLQKGFSIVKLDLRTYVYDRTITDSITHNYLRQIQSQPSNA